MPSKQLGYLPLLKLLLASVLGLIIISAGFLILEIKGVCVCVGDGGYGKSEPLHLPLENNFVFTDSQYLPTFIIMSYIPTDIIS